MSTVKINMFRNQHMDITAHMIDADKILDIFRMYDVRFEKKFTSLNQDGPSTITFKSVRCPEKEDGTGMFDILVLLFEKARNDEIGDIGVRFRSFFPPQQRPQPVNKEETVEVPDISQTTDETL